MKTHPFTAEQIIAAAEQFPTPFHLYDQQSIRAGVQALQAAFAWAPEFTNYFAVKATPTPAILSILAAAGCGMDCSSLAELVLAQRIGLAGAQIMFSSNNTPAEEFWVARQLGAIINLDDLAHLEYLRQHAGLPETICFRYNPGPLREGNAIIGRPEEAKFGVTRAQLFEGYAQAREWGVQHFGLHTMVASNELDPGYFVATARMLFELAAELHAKLGIRIDFVNLGGGIGIPYKPDQQPVDLMQVSQGIRQAYQQIILPAGLDPLQIAFECGRLLTGPYGILVTRVRHLKHTYKRYVGVDASMADLMRPGIYSAYHHMSVVGRENAPSTQIYDVTGSLCENNDKFAIDRWLPTIAIGDLLAIHDTGAHGRAMGFNYNGKLRSAELLLQANGSIRCIRRAETLEDYYATLIFDMEEHMAEQQTETWDLWYPKAGATGISFARGRCGKSTEVLLVHAAPPIITVTVQDTHGQPVAQGIDLEATDDTPIMRLTRHGDRIEREDIWPTASDIGQLLLLPGGEVATLVHWWNAPDHSEWRWQIELYNHR